MSKKNNKKYDLSNSKEVEKKNIDKYDLPDLKEVEKKNINKYDLPDLPDLTELGYQYLEKSRDEILNILVDQYQYDGDTAFNIWKNIFTSTNANLGERYTFTTPFEMTSECQKKLKTAKNLNYMNYSFLNWSFIALSVPYYQSLGDTIGYYNGKWEFNYGDVRAGPDYVNEMISEFISLGGINDFNIKGLLASDDTIMYIATAEVLTNGFTDINDFGNKIKKAYLDIMPIMADRHPGITTKNSLEIQQIIDWDKLPYSSSTRGAGSAMRSGCIGIFYPGSHNRKKLIELAVESSRITHNSAITILGSIVAALFTAYALEKVPIGKWPRKFVKLFDSGIIDEYMEKSRPKDYEFYKRDKIIYIGQWKKYINFRFGVSINPRMDIKFMKNTVQRYKYLADNYSIGCDIPGGCADDALIMAYDALLESEGVFEKIVVYSVLHPGDSDTVGSIALSWYGAFYNSPRNKRLIGDKFDDLEFHNKLYEIMKKNAITMTKIYYYDIFMNTARKYLKQYIK